MHKTAYIICEETGEYDSYCSTPVMVTLDESKAEDFRNEMEQRSNRSREVYNQIEAHLTVWEKSNPRLSSVGIPRPKNSYKPTEKEKKAIEDWAAPRAEWAGKRHQEKLRFLSTFSEEEQADYNNFIHNSTWAITIADFLE